MDIPKFMRGILPNSGHVPGYTVAAPHPGKITGPAHPGFEAVQGKIAGEGYSKAAAGAILANATRNASAAAKRKNPRLKKVKTKK